MASPSVRMTALLLTALGLYLIGNASVPLMDRDEPRYAQCSRQMLQSGDWVVPRLYDEPRTAKPPLIYWCQAASMMLVDASPLCHWLAYPDVFAARLPSAVAMLCTIVLLWMTLRRGLPEAG